MTGWNYYYWYENDGFLRDEGDDFALFDSKGNPLHFDSAADAEQYLVDNDIRGTVH